MPPARPPHGGRGGDPPGARASRLSRRCGDRPGGRSDPHGRGRRPAAPRGFQSGPQRGAGGRQGGPRRGGHGPARAAGGPGGGGGGGTPGSSPPPQPAPRPPET